MSKPTRSTTHKPQKQGGKFLPALCGVLGTLIILAVIVVCLPLTVPRLFGYELFEVVSGSMAPAIPVGSVIYVEPAAPEEIAEKEIIAFWRNGETVTHRVRENHKVVGEFITKGDANELVDFEPVPYDALIGRVAYHAPVIGRLMRVLSSTVGKLYLLCFACCGVMFNRLSTLLRARPAPEKIRWEELSAAVAETQEEKRPEKPRRGRWRKIRRALILFAALAFLGSTAGVLYIRGQYQKSVALYDDAASRFTAEAEAPAAPAAIPLNAVRTASPAVPSGPENAEPENAAPENTDPDPEHKRQIIPWSYDYYLNMLPPRSEEEREALYAEKEVLKAPEEPDTHRLDEYAPITVDFEALRAVNPDVVGWIYCPDTPINYPVLHGATNDSYLHHSYDKSYNVSGSIFVDAANARDFIDASSTLYGHHMSDNSMFATLDYWQKQDYFDEHPVMWLLTPEQDYKIALFSAYNISAYDSVYAVQRYPGDAFNAFLETALARSAVKGEVELDPEGHYVLLSTCAYVFDNARSVIHGMLLPLSSAGGVALNEERGA